MTESFMSETGIFYAIFVQRINECQVILAMTIHMIALTRQNRLRDAF